MFEKNSSLAKNNASAGRQYQRGYRFYGAEDGIDAV